MPDSDQTDFDQLWDYDRPAETEARFRELVPGAEKNRSYYLQLLTQIARALGLQRKFTEAHQTLDQVDSMLGENFPLARVRYLLERGRVYNSSGHPELSTPYFEQALELAAQSGEDFYAIDAIHMLAIVDQPEKGLDWNLKALALAERSHDPRTRNWLGSLYNNIGWTYHDQGDYSRALEYFQEALDFRLIQGRLPEIRIARWCVARGYRSLGRVEEALELQTELLKEYEQAGEQSGYVFEEMGECLLGLGRPDEAKPFFARAFEALSLDPWLVENEPGRLSRLRALGN